MSEPQDTGRPGARATPNWGLRSRVFARDAGRCTLCGRNCTLLEAWRDLLRNDEVTWTRGRVDLARHLGLTAHELLITFWNVDHHRPRAEGGSNDLANLRTLCVWCHKHETAELTLRRAACRAPFAEIPLNEWETSAPTPKATRMPQCEHVGCERPATSWCHASCCSGETATCDEHEHVGARLADMIYGGQNNASPEAVDALDRAVKKGWLSEVAAR